MRTVDVEDLCAQSLRVQERQDLLVQEVMDLQRKLSILISMVQSLEAEVSMLKVRR